MYIMSTISFQELQVTNTDLLFAITVSSVIGARYDSNWIQKWEA